MLRLLYSLLLYLALPLVLLRLWRRGRQNPAYRQRWGERLGRFPAPTFAVAPIWLHAVSVGEVMAAAPLIRALRARYPDCPLVVTTTTPTGSDRLRALCGADVFHVYLPYDLPGAVRRFLGNIRPRLAVILETELWPNLFHHCAKRRIPLVIANARLSPRSAAGYARLASLVRTTLAKVSLIAAQGEGDAERFQALGADPGRLQVMGNLKFDQALAEDLPTRAQALRQQLGATRPVWVAGSTHEGEDEQVLAAFAQLRRSLPEALLVLVPRHPERFNKVAALVEQRGLSLARRSRQQPCTADTAVYLGDTLGELPLFYAAADLAFVGGSLVATGGHNLLEPAAVGVPVLCGPHLFNFQEIGQALLEAGAVRKVMDEAELALLAEKLLRDGEKRASMGEAGRALVADNRGALERLLSLLGPYLPPRP